MAQTHRAAGHDGRSRRGGHHDALRALRGTRGGVRRLCPHRPVEGPASSRGHLPAHRAQRADPGAHHHRHPARHDPGRRHRRRGGVRLARSRPTGRTTPLRPGTIRSSRAPCCSSPRCSCSSTLSWTCCTRSSTRGSGCHDDRPPTRAHGSPRGGCCWAIPSRWQARRCWPSLCSSRWPPIGLRPTASTTSTCPMHCSRPAVRTGSAPTSWAAMSCPACSSRRRRRCAWRSSAWRSPSSSG